MFSNSRKSFQQVLETVIFCHDRPGCNYLKQRKYLLRSAQNGRVLDATNWHAVVKEGTHVTQAMILSDDDLYPVSESSRGLGKTWQCWYASHF